MFVQTEIFTGVGAGGLVAVGALGVLVGWPGEMLGNGVAVGPLVGAAVAVGPPVGGGVVAPQFGVTRLFPRHLAPC